MRLTHLQQGLKLLCFARAVSLLWDLPHKQKVYVLAANVEAHTLAGCGHFMTEERPEFVVDHIVALTERLAATRAKELTA